MDLGNYHSYASGCECISQHLQFCKADKPRRGSKQYLIRAEMNWRRRAGQIWSQPSGTRLPSAAGARRKNTTKRILERDTQVSNGTHLQPESKHLLGETIYRRHRMIMTGTWRMQFKREWNGPGEKNTRKNNPMKLHIYYWFLILCLLNVSFLKKFWPRLTTCKILTFQPGIKPVSPAVEAQRTGREVPLLLFLKPQDSLSIINNVWNSARIYNVLIFIKIKAYFFYCISVFLRN